MANFELSSAGLDERRRRALFRARRRGMREMDLVIGQFADRDLSTMDEAELAEFERLLDLADPQILAWIVGDEPTPATYDTPLFHRLRAAPREALATKANQK
jgi:antitoxin CptB